MTWPGSVLVPIMELGRLPPLIQPGAPAPPVIRWYPAERVVVPPAVRRSRLHRGADPAGITLISGSLAGVVTAISAALP